MNNKVKGFTLIELLAVIVILAIIAIIVTPIITGVIKKAKDSADLRSAEAYVKAGENYFSQSTLTNSTLDTNVIDNLDVSSKKAEEGSSLVVNNDGTTDMAIIIDDKCYRKTFSESIKDIKVTDITNDEDRNACNVPLKSDYAFLSKTISDKVGNKYFSGNGFLKNEQIKSISVAEIVPSTYQYSWEASDTSLSNNASIMAYAVGNDTDNYDLYLVSSKPIASPINSSKLFGNMNLTGDINLSWLTTYFTTNMADMFWQTGCKAMTTLNLGSNFDTSNVTDMYEMFAYAGSNVMISLDLGISFNTENVVNMSYMFYGTGYNAMTTLDLGSNFNAKSAMNVYEMFLNTGYNAMTSLNLGSNFNLASATTLTYMFENTGYNAMTTLDLGSNFNGHNATDMSKMFERTGFSNLETIKLGDNFDTSSVTDMSLMFESLGGNSSNFQNIDLGTNFDTSNVTDMNNMFAYAAHNSLKMEILDLGDKFDTSKVTDMEYFLKYFAEYSPVFKTLDLGDKFDTSNVTDMYAMFKYVGQESTQFTSFSLGNLFDTSKATDMNEMFGNMGKSGLMSFDLGSAFKNISINHYDWFYNTGASGCQIKVSSDIYSDSTHFKLNKDSSTTIEYTIGTLVSTY